jgi:hypothetical protein
MDSGVVIYIPSCIKIVSDFQVILRFRLGSLRRCNVGITDSSNYSSTPLRLAQVPWYTYQVSQKLIQAFEIC